MRRLSRTTLPRRQRGLALLVLLALFATAAAYMLVSSLSKGSFALTLARADKNRAVLQEAKAALIAWSAQQALTAAIPGALPCPDLNNDGVAEGTCTAAQRIGRLPYKTLGIGELRDASGELLWYGVSRNFRNYSNTVNSDTLGTLSVTGPTPATNAVAVVLAPGMNLGTQDRSPGGANTAANYLEDVNGNTDSLDYIARPENLDAAAGILFNDQLLVITREELLSAVEPVVAARIERDIVRQYIFDPSDTSTSTQWTDGGGPNRSRYFDAWGRFPFAAPFSNPGSSSFTGAAATYEGLLPMVDIPNYYWNGGSGTVVKTGGSGSISSSCSTPGSPNTILRCDINSSGSSGVQPSFRMSGTVTGIGFSFVQLPRIADVSTSGGSITGTRSLSGSLSSSGTGTVMLDATMPWSWSGTTITVDIRNDNLITSPLVSPTDGIAGWFTTNNWHLNTYYAVSPGFAPGGAGSCNPSSIPYCLTVDNVAAPTNNKRAIVILAGRSLSGASRPNGTPSDYLEAKNYHTVVGYAFEHSLRRTTTGPVEINDRVIVIAP